MDAMSVFMKKNANRSADVRFLAVNCKLRFPGRPNTWFSGKKSVHFAWKYYLSFGIPGQGMLSYVSIIPNRNIPEPWVSSDAQHLHAQAIPSICFFSNTPNKHPMFFWRRHRQFQYVHPCVFSTLQGSGMVTVSDSILPTYNGNWTIDMIDISPRKI